MKIDDFPLIELMEVYSGNDPFPNNMNEREVACTICKYRVMTNLTNPYCKQCGSNLVNVVRSHFNPEQV